MTTSADDGSSATIQYWSVSGGYLDQALFDTQKTP